MTEAEWLACTDPQVMLEYLRGRVSDRKLWLFAVACCRRWWDSLFFDVFRRLLDVVEKWTDDRASQEEVNAIHERLWEAGLQLKWYSSSHPAFDASEAVVALWPELNARQTAESIGRIAGAMKATRLIEAADHSAWRRWFRLRKQTPSIAAIEAEFEKGRVAEQQIQAELLYCIIGNPFRPVASDPRWRSKTAVTLASAIYAERAFDRLPILADVLEEAGCDHPDVLAHCRGSGRHARGCWVIDLVLGKS